MVELERRPGAESGYCRECYEPIRLGARICPQCGCRQQTDIRHLIGSTFRWLGGATAILSLAAVAYQLWSIYSVHLEERAYLENLVATAERQHELRELLRAWETLDEALEIERSYAPARDLQLTVAAQLVRDTLKISRSKHRGYGSSSGTTWYGGDVDQVDDAVERVLYRASASRDERRAADALAHLAWRIVSVKRYEPHDPLLDRSLTLDPENPYALIALRHVQLGRKELPAAERLEESRALLERARASAAARGEDREVVSRFVETMAQVSLLMPQELPFAIEALRLADAARQAGLRPSHASKRSYVDLFELLAYRPVEGTPTGYPELSEAAAVLIGTFGLDRLALIYGWLELDELGNAPIRRLKSGRGWAGHERELDQVAARAILLEQEGELDLARIAYLEARKASHLAPLADDALQRLGAPPVSAGPGP